LILKKRIVDRFNLGGPSCGLQIFRKECAKSPYHHETSLRTGGIGEEVFTTLLHGKMREPLVMLHATPDGNIVA